MIYFVRSIDAIKIGYSEDPKKRIAELQVGASEQLECLLVIDGNKDDERNLHERFGELSTKSTGEWFHIKQPIFDFIHDNAKNDRRYEFDLLALDFAGNEQLKRLRKQHNLTLKKMGILLGITSASVNDGEIREFDGTITINRLKRVAKSLGYRLEYRFVRM
jgi:DNA-binding XRE family transcriptional regulator